MLSAGLPTGLQFLAQPWDEATLLKLAYAYEQHTHHRGPPSLVSAAVAARLTAANGQASAGAMQNSAVQAAESGR